MNKIEGCSAALYCYDNSVDISDELQAETSIHEMEILRKAVVQSVQRMRNERNRPHHSHDVVDVPCTRYGSEDVFSIHISKNSEAMSLLSVKSESKIETRKRVYKVCPNERHTEPSLRKFLLTEDDDDDMKKFTCLLLKTLNSTNELRDAKSISNVSDGSILITDFLGNKVTLFENNGKARRRFANEGVSEPWAAVMTGEGLIAATLRRQGCVAIWSNVGESMEAVGQGELLSPCGLAVDRSGRIIVTDESKNDVIVFDKLGKSLFKFTDFHETSFKQPRYVCCSSSDRIIVSDSGNHCVKVFDSDGQFLFKFGSFGRNNGQFKFPYGVCVDQEDNIIVADHYNNRIVMFSENGDFIQNLITSSLGLKSPSGVCYECTEGLKLYVTHGELRMSKVDVFELKSLGV